MQYRIKQVERYGSNYYYPQYKKFLLWRRLVWYGGEDGYTPMTCFYSNKEHALERIEQDKEKRKQKALDKPQETIYHYIN